MAALALLSAASAAPLSTSRVNLETEAFVSNDWAMGPRASPAQQLEMTFALSQSNVQELASRVEQTSDPSNAGMYGKHLTREQADALTAPSAEAQAAVAGWLASHGAGGCERNGNGDLLRCTVAVETAEAMLGAEYRQFSHAKSGLLATRALAYSLPAHVAPHLDFVSPTVRLPTPQRSARVGKVDRAQRQNTPATLRSLYNVGAVEGTPGSKNKQACTAFLKQFYKPTDLTAFWKKYYPKASGRTVKLVGPDTGPPGVEASLDIEYISTMGGGVDTEFWSFAGSAPDNPQNEPFLKWMFLVGNTSDATVPKIFSTSYGEAEHTVTLAYMTRVNAEFIKMASRGLSLLFASGDSGVADDGGSCPKGHFAGQWPAGSPWVTAVGGTEGGARLEKVPEEAWSGSSGGFSWRWERPKYQKEAVTKYLKTATLPAASHYNGTNRGFPDVSAQATNFLVINGGHTEGVAGTSCACPTFSGIVGLLNDLRIKAGKSSLGMLNPMFYQNAAAFTDITKGSNPGCGTKGFPAIAGWDPVTGLGTPDYKALAKVVAALP